VKRRSRNTNVIRERADGDDLLRAVRADASRIRRPATITGTGRLYGTWANGQVAMALAIAQDGADRVGC
jgi:hypothetical protein